MFTQSSLLLLTNDPFAVVIIKFESPKVIRFHKFHITHHSTVPAQKAAQAGEFKR